MSVGKGIISNETQKWWNKSWVLNNEWVFNRCPRSKRTFSIEEQGGERNKTKQEMVNLKTITFFRYGK